MAEKKRILGLPDFTEGWGAPAFAVIGVFWIIASLVYKQHWFMILIGILITIKGIMKTIENSQKPKAKKKSAIRATREQFAEIKRINQEYEAMMAEKKALEEQNKK